MKISIKVVVLCLTSFFAFAANAAPPPMPELPMVNGRICYTDVVEVDSTLSKADLYEKAKNWFKKSHRPLDYSIQVSDAERGVIIGKARTKVYHRALGDDYPSGYINYTFSIHVKDGKYKYEITDFHHTGSGNIPSYGACEAMINTTQKTWGMSNQKTYDYYFFVMNDNIVFLIKDLNNAMTPSGIGNDDW